MRRITVLFVFLLTHYLVHAQSAMEVLPSSGRSELFHTYLMDQLAIVQNERGEAYAKALETQANLEAYQQNLRESYWSILGGFPEKNDLNAQTFEQINKGSYTIELVAYESRTNHHVVANLYRPNGDGETYPAVIVPCGHYGISNIKAWDYYQRLGILLASQGYVALIIDPVASGERAQILKEDGSFAFQNNSGTSTHSRLSVGSELVGTSIPAYEVWDNHRGIDYLISRSDVDAEKIGVVGSSGGGAQTLFLIGYDERIKVAGVVSAMTTVTNMWANGGPQDGCQNLAHQGMYGIDQQDYLTMLAPNAAMVLQGSQDALFLSEGAAAGYADSKQAFDKLEIGTKIAYFESNDGHGFTQPKREEAVRWLNKWFKNNDSEISEPNYDDQLLTYDELMVTSTGQVMTAFENEKNITTLNLEMADALSGDRSSFWSNGAETDRISKISQLIGYEKNAAKPVATLVDTVQEEGYYIEKLKIEREGEFPVLALKGIPAERTAKSPAVIYVNGLGKSVDWSDGGFIERFYLDSGYVVMSIDVRGFGETADASNKNEAKHNNKEHRNNVISSYMGKSLVGQRVADVMTALDALLADESIDAENVKIVGLNRAVPMVMHAAYISGAFSEVNLWDYQYSSMRGIVAAPLDKDNMTHLVVGALKYYDYENLLNAISSEVIVGEQPEIPPMVEEPALALTELNQNSAVIYPNPTDGKFKVSFLLNQKTDLEVSVFNMEGKLVETERFSQLKKGVNSISMNLSHLQAGIYWLQMNQGDEASSMLKVKIQ